jgi:hypothetical protein
MSQWDLGPERFCERCGVVLRRKLFGKTWEGRPNFLRRKFCSLSCSSTRQVVGYTGHSARARRHLKNSCERCGRGGPYLNAHHLDENRENNSSDNIQTLCNSCHAWWHHEARRRGLQPAGIAPPLGGA